MPDLNAASVEAAMSMIAGTCRSMGVTVEESGQSIINRNSKWEGYPDITTRRYFFKMKRGKKYTEAAKVIERGTLYDRDEAISLVKKTAVAKFDETIEAHIRTGCDGTSR